MSFLVCHSDNGLIDRLQYDLRAAQRAKEAMHGFLVMGRPVSFSIYTISAFSTQPRFHTD